MEGEELRTVSIGKYAFAHYVDIDCVYIEDGIRHIGVGAFAHCVCLQTIILPRRLSFIGARAFWHCLCLCVIACCAPTPPVIEEDLFPEYCDPFEDVPDSTILLVPRESIPLYRCTKYWNRFVLRSL